MEPRKLLRRAYEAFNGRDIDSALSLMQPKVEWPNGVEGGFVFGHEGVREYWTRQWQQIDPRVEALLFLETSDGRIAVEVHQEVRNREGKVISDHFVQHIYSLRDGLIDSMEIRA